jgi:hypothetical protein
MKKQSFAGIALFVLFCIALGVAGARQQPAPLPTEGHNTNALPVNGSVALQAPHSPVFLEQMHAEENRKLAIVRAAAAAGGDTIVASNAAFSWQLDITKMLAVPSCAGVSGCTIFTKICQANNGGNCIDLADGANTYQIITDRTVNGAIVRTEIGTLGIGVQKMAIGPGQLTF